MATLTATQSGDIDTPATWGGSTFVDGDDLVIGAFDVTCNAPHTIGAAGIAGTFALQLSSTGSFVNTAAMVLRGDISHAGSFRLRFGANVTWFGPSGVTYKYTSSGSGTPTFEVLGTAGSPVMVTSNTTAGGGQWYADWQTNGPNLEWRHAVFTAMGSTGDTVATRAWTHTGRSGGYAYFSNVFFGSSMGRQVFTGWDFNNFHFQARNSDWRSGQNGVWIRFQNSTNNSTGTRLFSECTFHDTTARTVSMWARDFTFEYCVFSNTKVQTEINDQRNRFKWCIVMDDTSINGIFVGTGKNSTIAEDMLFYTNCNNPHYCSFQAGDAGLNTPVIRRAVIDGNNFATSDSGDFILGNANPIILEQILGINGSCTLVSILAAGTTTRVFARRCTLTSGYYITFEAASAAENLREIISCIFTGQPNAIRADVAVTAQTNLRMSRNCVHNQTDAANANHSTLGFNGPFEGGITWFASGSYGDEPNNGADDFSVDPQFVDSSRNVVAYYDSVFGSGGSYSNARNEFLKRNGYDASGSAASFNTAMRAELALPWIQEGFRPQAEECRGRGDQAAWPYGPHDVGAVDMLPIPYDGGRTRTIGVRPRIFAPALAR